MKLSVNWERQVDDIGTLNRFLPVKKRRRIFVCLILCLTVMRFTPAYPFAFGVLQSHVGQTDKAQQVVSDSAPAGIDGVIIRRTASFTVDGDWLARQETILDQEAVQSNAITYVYADHLGSPVASQEINGASPSQSTGQSRFRPFGAKLHGEGDSIQSLGFTGHKYDEFSGLIYMNARYYLPSLRRFVSADSIVPDPAEPQSWNRYSYVNNSPLNFTDPSGHCPQPSNLAGHPNIICLSLFIPTRYSETGSSVVFAGDNRPFSEASSPTASRMWVWIDADTAEILNPPIYQTMSDVYIHSTRRTHNLFYRECHEDCVSRPSTENSVTVSQIDVGPTWRHSKPIAVNYDLVCADRLCHPVYGPNGYVAFLPNVDGGLTSYVSAEQFPNMEAYFWKEGDLYQILFQIQNYPMEDLLDGRGKGWTAASMLGPKLIGGDARIFNGFYMPTSSKSTCIADNMCN